METGSSDSRQDEGSSQGPTADKIGTQKVSFRAPQTQFTSKDFAYGKLLGLGSYSKVVKATKKDTGVIYALKIMDKLHIVKENKTACVKLERVILDQLDHPGIVRLYFTFQDAHYLYMGLECCEGGELFDQIQRKKNLSLNEAGFYASELVEVIEYLHGQGLVHRDLKPENLLLTKEGHLKVADFGSAKTLKPSNGLLQNMPDDKSCTLVGTAEYVAPEVLNSHPVTAGVDLWALGCILYQMLVGRPPFKCATEYLTFQKIMARDFEFPAFLSLEAKDLINQLLDLDPNKRPGSGRNGFVALKAHPFFQGTEWSQLWKLPAPSMVPPSDSESSEDEDTVEDDDLDSDWAFAHIGGAEQMDKAVKKLSSIDVNEAQDPSSQTSREA